MKRILVLTALAALPLCGCMSSAGFSKTIRELSRDPAIVSGTIQTPYGAARFVRIGGTTNSVTVSPDGTVTVNSK